MVKMQKINQVLKMDLILSIYQITALMVELLLTDFFIFNYITCELQLLAKVKTPNLHEIPHFFTMKSRFASAFSVFESIDNICVKLSKM